MTSTGTVVTMNGSEQDTKGEALAEEVREILVSTRKKPKKKTYRDAYIERSGSRIILPDGMSYDDAIQWIAKRKDEEEQIIAFKHTIDCSPLDGAVALKRAVDAIFGYSTARGQMHPFFGEQPPRMIEVHTDVGQTMLVPWDKMQPPPLEGGFVETGIEIGNNGAVFSVRGQCKRKYEKTVLNIVKLVRHILENDSIYRGKAIKVISLKPSALRDLEGSAPQFMDLNIDEENLILSEETMAQLSTSVYLRLEKTEECKKNGVPLKHGCLLMGPYGTGKTLTAKVVAKKCVENGWTFIYLDKSRELPEAIMFAKMYAPAVVFSEDIDKAVGEERTGIVDSILNTIDGIDTKELPIITVLTTNHPEKIHPGFLRAGRIDTVIPVDCPDGKTVERFIRYYGRDAEGKSILKDGANLAKPVAAMEGFVPSFIAEVVNKAKMFAFYRDGKLNSINEHDLLNAANGLIAHKNLMKKNHQKEEKTTAEILTGSLQVVMEEATRATTKTAIQEVIEELQEEEE